jgi:hypothetical protein
LATGAGFPAMSDMSAMAGYHIPHDLKAWNRELMLKIFPYLHDVKIDLACSKARIASHTSPFGDIAGQYQATKNPLSR